MANPAWGVVGFEGIETLGARMTYSRGVRPSVCEILTAPIEGFDRIVGTLWFHYDGFSPVVFKNAASPGVVYYRNREREQDRWTIHVYDRRWRWRYPRVYGIYNERAPNGKVQPSNKKNLRQLVSICLDHMGEANYDVSLVPDNVYPPATWHRAKAAYELEWLCDLVGMTVVVRLNDTVKIVPAMDPNGAGWSDLPLVAPPAANKPGTIPQSISVQGDPTVIQDKLPLEAVGLDDDGSVRPLDQLSYAPIAGGVADWTLMWPEHFSELAQDKRHLAFKSVYRWYRPLVDASNMPDCDVSHSPHNDSKVHYRRELELLDQLAECQKAVVHGAVTTERYTPLPPVVTGVFWPACDHPINTDSTAFYDGTFRRLPGTNIIEFEHPVFKWDSGSIKPADLYLTTAYRVRHETEANVQYVAHSKSLDVASANMSTRPLVLQHPELFKTKINSSPYGTAVGDNKADIEAEMDVYLAATAALFSYNAAVEVTYDGLLPWELDGAFSQVEYRCGQRQFATTRVGRYMEFDPKTIRSRQRRALRRLSQMSQKMTV